MKIVINTWVTKEELPKELEEIRDLTRKERKDFNAEVEVNISFKKETTKK